MKPPEGFELGKCIRSSSGGEVYFAQEEASGRQVILKSYRGSDAYGAARREFERLRKGAGPGLLAPIDLDTLGPEPLLILEGLDAELLSERARAPLPIGDWLHMASQLAATLRQLHARHWIHRDLHPGGVLVARETGDPRLFDLELAVELGSAAPNAALGEPGYMAPEQFGRMGRGIDFRSDLYSLGATLYHALTGTPPFHGEGTLEMMHAHMALRAQPPAEVLPEVPAPLSELVMKLLQKEPDERYQSASALHQDLLACSRLWAEGGGIPADFALAAGDADSRPLFPKRRLYGRDEEIAALAEGLERVTAGGSELWLLRGAPGVGKSILIEELRWRSVQKGWLAQGKFDLYRTDQPYSGWSAALGSLAHQILVRGEEDIAAWRERIHAGLGANVAVLVEWIPDWGFLLGEQSPPPRLPPRETQVRLGRTVVRLLHAAARPGEPLILFLDDLQWADSGSRILLRELALEPAAGLLLVGTYRDGEIDSVHPLWALLQEIEKSPLPVHALTLGALHPDATRAMLADAFEKPASSVEGLARLVRTKTENNPFLIQQFVEHMRSLGYISFSGTEGWSWDLESIASADISDDAVELVAARIERIEPHAREVLVFASFIGDEFDAELLRHLANRDLDAVEFALCALSESGLIVPCPSGFRFVHDRIREAAQSLRTGTERAQLHYDTASLLMDHTPPEGLRERAPDLAEHFNRALELIPAEKVPKILQLNVWSAQRALEAGAPDTARAYIDRAHPLALRDDAAIDPVLLFEVDFLRAETRVTAGEYAEADAIARSLAERDVGPVRFARAAALRIDIYAFMSRESDTWEAHDAERAMEIGVLALRKLRAPYPTNPSLLRAVLEVLYTLVKIRHLTAQDFLRESKAADERQQALIRVERSLGVIYYVRPNRALTANARRIRLFREGYASGFLPGAMIGLCMVLMVGFRRRKLAERIGHIALELLDAGYMDRSVASYKMGIHYFVFGWTRHMTECAKQIDALRDGILEEGDLATMAMAAAVHAGLKIQGGPSLQEAIEACRVTCDFARRAHDTGTLQGMEDGIAILECLEAPDRLTPESHPYTAPVRPATETFRGFFWTVLGDFGRAYTALEGMPVVFGVPDRLPFHRALASAGFAASRDCRDPKRVKKLLRRDHREIRNRARLAPNNFLHQSLQIEAEWARLAGKRKKAVALSQEALQRAREANYLLDTALILERLAALLLESDRNLEAAERIQQALELYERWGAGTKVAQLRNAHGERLRMLTNRRC